jgi:hypothetical protein
LVVKDKSSHHNVAKPFRKTGRAFFIPGNPLLIHIKTKIMATDKSTTLPVQVIEVNGKYYIIWLN